MNNNLLNAQLELGKADAIMHSIENLYMDFDFLPEEKETAERGAYIFLAAWDAIKKAAEYLDNYSAECRIVDVIQANREAHAV